MELQLERIHRSDNFTLLQKPSNHLPSIRSSFPTAKRIKRDSPPFPRIVFHVFEERKYREDKTFV